MITNIFSSKAFSSFIMVCVYFLFIYFISDFIYAGNDDRGLIYILSGHNADASYYTQFMSWYISMLLAGLYSLAPAFPFMGCLFLLCMFISVWYVTYYILQKSKSVWTSVFLILLLYFGLYRLICQTTFTYIPAFLAIPLVLIAFEIKTDNKKLLIQNLILFSIFAILSIGIRTEVFIMLIPYLLLIVVVQNIKDKSKRGSLFLIPLVAIVCAFCIGGNAILEKNPEYKYTIEYSEVRADIMDFYGLPSYDENKALYDSLDISREAYELMANWYFDMPEASLENMIAIRDYQKANFSLNIDDSLLEIRNSFATTRQLLFVAIILAIITGILLYKNEKKSLLIMAGFVFGTILISLCLSILMKFPERLAICLLLCNIAFYIVFVSKYLIINTQKLRLFSVYILVAVFGLTFLLNNFAYDNSSHKAFINDYRQFEQHISLDTEYVYVLDIRLQSFGERLFNSNQKCVNLYQNGWPIWFPCYNQQILGFGEKTFYDYIKNDKPLKYIASSAMDPDALPFNKYIQVKLNKKFVKIEEYKDYVIYEVVSNE